MHQPFTPLTMSFQRPELETELETEQLQPQSNPTYIADMWRSNDSFPGAKSG